MKLITHRIHQLLDDEAQYVLDCIEADVEKALSINRTVYSAGLQVGIEDIYFSDDSDFEEANASVFAIIEADESETLAEAVEKGKEELRRSLRVDFGKTERQQKLFS